MWYGCKHCLPKVNRYSDYEINLLFNFAEWCEEGQYVCANARQCIEMARVCDGTPDCPLGDDEKSCVALADELEDNEVIPYNEEGTFS